jgi:hypothetical protein
MIFFNRYNLKAAGIHLAVCAVIAVLSIGLVYGLWYPAPLSAALGVSEIFLLLLAIDIALGPLLTLVVYKPYKSSLKFDLTVIGIVQLAALAYGLHTVGAGRPAYIVFTKDRFDLVQAYEVAEIHWHTESATASQDSARSNAPSRSSKPTLTLQNHWAQPLLGFEWRSATAPKVETAAQGEVATLIMYSALSGGPDIPHIAAYQQPYALALPRIQALAQPLSSHSETLKIKDAATQLRLVAMQAKYPAGSAVMPLKIKYTIYTVVLNPASGAVLGIEPVDVF